jgi:ribosomal protein S18 acetylase RimI-like enzyme
VLVLLAQVLGENPHCYYYVINLGVAPAAQGQGVGSKLIAAAAAIAKDKNVHPISSNATTAILSFMCDFEQNKHFPMAPLIM